MKKSNYLLPVAAIAIGTLITVNASRAPGPAPTASPSFSTIELAHRGGKTKHRHCHERFRRAEFVLVCHTHEHGERHQHLRGRG